MKTVPYQQCPVCYGKGFVFIVPATTTNVTEVCTVCKGAKIIPQYVVEEKGLETTIKEGKVLSEQEHNMETASFEKWLGVDRYVYDKEEKKYIPEPESVEEKAFSKEHSLSEAIKGNHINEYTDSIKAAFKERKFSIQDMEECFNQARESEIKNTFLGQMRIWKHKDFYEYMNIKK